MAIPPLKCVRHDIKHNDQLHLVFKVEIARRHLRAFIQAKLRNIRTGHVRASLPPADAIEKVVVDEVRWTFSTRCDDYYS